MKVIDQWPYNLLAKKNKTDEGALLWEWFIFSDSPEGFAFWDKVNSNIKPPITPEIIAANPDIFRPDGLPIRFAVEGLFSIDFFNWFNKIFGLNVQGQYNFYGYWNGMPNWCSNTLGLNDDVVILSFEHWNEIIYGGKAASLHSSCETACAQTANFKPNTEEEFIPGEMYEFSDNGDYYGYNSLKLIVALPENFKQRFILDCGAGCWSASNFIRKPKPMKITHEMIVEKFGTENYELPD
jgi:hypothetical protein